VDDLYLYDRVADELRNRGAHPGLWAKAFAESGGNKPQAEALYLRYRVAQLAAAELAADEAGRQINERVQRTAAERDEAERRERAKSEGLTPIHWLLISLGAFFIILLVLRATAVL
jgi:hypothetical protein